MAKQAFSVAAVLCVLLFAAGAAGDPLPPTTTTTVTDVTTTAPATTSVAVPTTTTTVTTVPATTTTTPPPAATTTPPPVTTAPPEPTTTTEPAAATTAPPATTSTPATTETAPAPPRPATTTTTTTKAGTTTERPPARVATLAALRLPTAGCSAAAAVGIRYPNGHLVVIGAGAAPWAYPADGSLVTIAGLDDAGGCGAGVAARGVTLLGGLVRADVVRLAPGGAASADHVVVGGRPVAPGARVVLPGWGYLDAGGTAVVRHLSSVRLVATERSAISIELTRARAGLPAGTVLLLPLSVSAVHVPVPEPVLPTVRKPHHAKHKPKGPQPLEVTPRLTAGPYTFPVAGDEASFGDTYGAQRTDVPGGWHHGDDIFAPLGTPVVAVADGTLNRVGWELLGGWRLWVRDRAGDEFYYAHLSGYTPLALKGGKVKAGDVIGFVGNTGDAFTTDPHVHFEVHPRSLLHLHYNGAVNPTTYLDGWKHLAKVQAPTPVHPQLPPASAARFEAVTDWRRLLALRGPHPAPASAPPATEAPSSRPHPPAEGATALAASTAKPAGGMPYWPFLLAALLIVALGGFMWRGTRLS